VSWVVPEARGPVAPLAEPPTFSIVIAAFQAAETIGEAVASALAQTLPAREVIVVDDGSTDGSAAALEPFAGRITVLRREHRGGAAAHNTGTRAASGDYVVRLDADDRFHPRRLQALAELASARPDLDLITTDARFIVDGRPAGTFHEHNPFAVSGQRTAIFWSCFPGGWPAVLRRRLLAVGGFDEGLRTGEDWDCWLRLILDGSLAGLVDEPLYDYVRRPGSLTADRVGSLWDRVRLLEKAWRNPSVRPQERGALRGALRMHRSRAVRSELEAGASRSRIAGLTVMRGIDVRTRARAAAALLSPGIVR
jgi:glycosyltransferase involved in cell wall biosynthesis